MWAQDIEGQEDKLVEHWVQQHTTPLVVQQRRAGAGAKITGSMVGRCCYAVKGAASGNRGYNQDLVVDEGRMPTKEEMLKRWCRCSPVVPVLLLPR